MSSEIKKRDKQEIVAIVLKVLVILVALTYYALLIGGKKIFGEGSEAYIGLNIFITNPTANPWLRTLGYTVFLLSLSFVVRFVLKKSAVFLKKGKAIVALVCSFIKYLAVLVLIFVVLKAWGVDTATLLAGAGILSLIVGLGAQPLIEDIIAGLFIVFEELFDVGDIIVVDGFRGTVKEIGIRTTQIEDAGGDIKVVNNSDIRTLVNMTSQLSLAICEVDIEYGESLERVEVVIKNNLEAIKAAIPDISEGPYYMGVSALGASGVRLRFSAKCVESQKFQVERDLNRQIKLLFDRNDINIPFTQVVLHEAQRYDKANVGEHAEAKAFVEEQRALSRGIGDEETQSG